VRNLLIIISIIFFNSLIVFGQNHKLFTEILKDNVHDGLVNYKSLVGSDQLNKYLEQLSATDPDKLKKNEKLAYWINAYNAFTLQVVLENYPIKSITSLHTGGKVIGFLLGKTVWDKEFITINGKEYSLNYIEHEILRKMDEPRIHFAIVCASISCPVMRNEAYEADKIETQLEEQTRLFLNDTSRNSFNLEEREADISQIFNWFDEDFGDSDENILKFISEYLPENIKNDILNNIDQWDVSNKSYDWGLNDIDK
jgi:hypothetical protein